MGAGLGAVSRAGSPHTWHVVVEVVCAHCGGAMGLPRDGETKGGSMSHVCHRQLLLQLPWGPSARLEASVLDGMAAALEGPFPDESREPNAWNCHSCHCDYLESSPCQRCTFHENKK